MTNIDTPDTDNEFLWKFIGVILRWRRLLLVNSFIATLLTFIIMISFFPNWFTATTSIMPPEKDSGGLNLGGMLPGGLGALLGGSGMSLPGLASPSDLYASVVKSKIVSQAVVEKNNLKESFGIDLDSKVLDELAGRTSVIVQPEGIINISYEDTDPVLAAAVANSYVEELNRVNQEHLVSKAKATREFIERRLNESINDLAAAEEAYRKFQQDNNAFALDEQVKASINAVAQLKGELVLAEIELGVMKKSLLPNNTRYKNQEFKIEQIKKQIDRMESGDSTSADYSILNIPISIAPELGLEFVRISRELKIQETIFELLKQQYEQAKIQEMRDTPTVQVLDVARVPEIKSRPKRVFTALLAGFLSFGFTLFFVIILEFVHFEKEKNSEIYHRLTGITDMLNEDFYWIRSLFGKKGKDNAS